MVVSRARLVSPVSADWRRRGRYVHIVESALNDSLTRHQRTAGGGYGRRTGERHHTRPVPLPFHLYGQLAHHRAGFDLVRSRPELAEMIRVRRTAKGGLWRNWSHKVGGQEAWRRMNLVLIMWWPRQVCCFSIRIVYRTQHGA